MGHDRIRGNLDLLLLGVLSAGPAHGYNVIAALKARSGEEFDLAEGTVYPALHGLESRGLVESSWQAIDGRRRRVYRLSDAGERELAHQSTQWKRFSAAVDNVLGVQA
ncbi:PadR family transcriptional regulator [Humibacter sp.]|jgi:DNA-binding PadR family transcriptional regulator|uniref:PadR family transcriptional regulator n=1 Tax=Humibacter sp. TaxID=1940291 RepID=UPI002C23D52E|nr:helix-turn-helix transcriptional regulator [Humibacter sp.]HVX09095.1 helix-turn-helix transcriptional regulator [Humibacter sp.]